METKSSPDSPPAVSRASTAPLLPAASSLLKVLGLAFGLAVTVGNTIGAGILRTPGDIAAQLGVPWLFIGIWVVGALYALCGANALAELGTMLPKAGAQYVYARRAFGEYAGFVVGWADWISTSASAAAIAIVIGESVVALFPQLGPHAAQVAMVLIVAFALLLSVSTMVGDRAQQLTSLLKAIAFFAFIAACFALGGHAQIPRATNAAAPAGGGGGVSLLAGFVLSAQAVIYAYDGWSAPVYFSEELDDPARQIPRAMFGGLLSVVAIYMLVNIAFLYVLPLSAFSGSPLAAATVARAIFGSAGDTVVRIVVVLALPSAVNACLLMASRVLYGMSRDGLGVAIGTRVNKGGTPTVALWASAAVALAMIASGTFETVIAIAAFFFVMQYTVSFFSLFVLRRREPTLPRPYRAKWHPWTTGLVLVGSLAFLASAVASDRQNSLWALGIVVVSYPVFLLRRRMVVG